MGLANAIRVADDRSSKLIASAFYSHPADFLFELIPERAAARFPIAVAQGGEDGITVKNPHRASLTQRSSG
jgi:hypothetical protein